MTRNKSSPIDINDAADRPRTSPAVPPTSDKNSKLVYSGFQGSVFVPSTVPFRLDPRTRILSEPFLFVVNDDAVSLVYKN